MNKDEKIQFLFILLQIMIIIPFMICWTALLTLSFIIQAPSTLLWEIAIGIASIILVILFLIMCELPTRLKEIRDDEECTGGIKEQKTPKKDKDDMAVVEHLDKRIETLVATSLERTEKRWRMQKGSSPIEDQLPQKRDRGLER